MNLKKKLNLFFLLMLFLSFAGATLAVWSVKQVNHQIDRMNLANDSYQQHLLLANNSYQMFKNYGDVLINNKRINRDDNDYFIGRIRTKINNIRNIIAAEIEMVGEEEVEELAALAEVERKIESFIAIYEQQVAVGNSSEFITNWKQLSASLQSELGKDFTTLIEIALAEEAEEVEESKLETKRLLFRYQFLSVGFALIALLAATAAFRTMQNQFSNPVEKLLDGVRRFSDGDLNHRLQLSGGDELAEIGKTFDEMADNVSANTIALTEVNVQLEETVRDRTRKLEGLLKDAKTSEKNRQQLLADVSHELRTPLTIIRGEADIALRGPEKSTETYKEALVRSRDAAAHTARLVDDLLFVARTEAKQLALKLEDVDLVQLVADVLSGVTSNISFQTSTKSAIARVDKTRITQAILVLLDNAKHYGGDEILVRLDQTTHGFKIAVEDNGTGMNDHEKQSAFQRYFRGSNAAEHYNDGTGLGLPVALAIANAHGGEVVLDDRVEGGLIAALMLPIRPKLKVVS